MRLIITAAVAAALLAPAGITAQQPAIPPRVSAILDAAPNDRAHWGIAVVDARTGVLLAGHNVDRLFVPASNTKLVVAAAAAHYLSPDFRYETTLESSGDIAAGVLRGDLVVRGTGDPTISGRYEERMLSVLEALADSLRALGVTRVDGGIVADESHWDSDYVRPDWESYDLLWWYAAPVGALGFNDNAIDFSIAPGATGAPARISWLPETEYVTFVNRTTTAAAGTRATLDLTRIPGTDTIVAYGAIPVDAARRTEYFAVADPARYTGIVLREVLESRGITFAHPTVQVIRGAAPWLGPPQQSAPRRVLVRHRSVPLPQLIAPVLQTSQNWFAEQLLKTIGREIGGVGSWERGLALERRFLIDVVGLDSLSFRLRDASGLSAGNLLTPRALVSILTHVQNTPRLAPVLDALPVSAARTGSLRSRLPDLAGRVRAKTGSIGNVDSLSGYLTTDGGRQIAFAIIANNTGQSSARMRSTIDDIVRALAAERF